jgi:tetratricopeptide (TPR) repeat protein
MELSPEAADALFDDIVAAVGRGERGRAVQLATAALNRGLDEPLVLLLSAEGHEQQGNIAQALRLLRQATEIAPDEPEPWHRLGNMLLRQGDVTDALAAFEAALRINPDIVGTLISAAAASFRHRELAAARSRFQRAAELAPTMPEPLAGLAAVAVRQGKSAEARTFAEQALALHPCALTADTAELSIARADLMDCFLKSAVERTSQLLARHDLNDDNRVAALDLRAEAHDALNHTTEAFADYQARNAILRESHSMRMEREIGERRVAQAKRLVAYFANARAEPWRAVVADDTTGANVNGHAFLIGVPRSGTTLLEKVLASHPGVVSLEEVDHLAAVGEHWLANSASLDALAHLSAPNASAAREDYWRRVRATIGDRLSGKLLLDKLPLHSLALPVIAKLFPGARILFALRDPRDVVLSCFRRRFQINAAMFEFLRLEDAAHYYEQVMTLVGIYRQKLLLPVLEVRHEAMVTEFETTVRGVLDFLGLGWDPAVVDFAARVPAEPRTPSDTQLARGLSAEGVGQWRRYKSQLEPVLDILAPWASRFGYPTSISDS